MAYVSSLFVSLDLAKCLMLLILVGAEVLGAPVQIQRTPFRNAVHDEDTVVLYCKTIGMHLQWEFRGRTLAIFNGDEEVGAVKRRTQRGNTTATAVLLSKALNRDNITVRISVLILNMTFIEDWPIRVDCLGGGMDQASYIVTEPIGDNSQRTESTYSEITTISLDNPTSTSTLDFPVLGFEVASAPPIGSSLVLLLSHLVATVVL